MHVVFFFAGQVLDEKRRVVVRRHPVGNPSSGQVATVRRVPGPLDRGEPVAHARGRRPVRVPAPARMQPGRLRPDARVLEATGVGPAHVPGDPSVPSAQEPGLRARRVVTVGRQTPGAQGLAVRSPGKRVVPAAPERRRRRLNGVALNPKTWCPSWSVPSAAPTMGTPVFCGILLACAMS